MTTVGRGGDEGGLTPSPEAETSSLTRRHTSFTSRPRGTRTHNPRIKSVIVPTIAGIFRRQSSGVILCSRLD